MGVNPEIVGRVYPPSPPYEVGREKIREFAEAINATGPADAVHRDPEAARAKGYPDVIAPPTLAVIIAQRCEAQLITDPEAGIDFTRVVHGDQRFVHHRPIVAGDRLVATLHVDNLSTLAKNTMVVTRVEIVDEKDEPVTTSTSMIVVRAEDTAAEEETGEETGPVGQ